MNTIEAYEQEIRFQISDLARLVHESKIRKLNRKEQERCVFTGTGDSFAAAMTAELASNNKVRCIDPTNICLNPSIVKDRILYAVSVSGNTRANVEAVNIANRRATKTVAVTANRYSKLAKNCDEVVELKFRNSGMLTAGSIGFTTSMLACLSLVRDLKMINVSKLFEQAENNSKGIRLNGHVYILGSWFTYPLAVYGCAKIYEVLGTKAQHAMLEQFFHMELFSLKKGDTILILADNDKVEELSARLDRCNVFSFKPKGKTQEDNLLYYSFLLQLIVLNNAKRLKLSECYFITNHRLRETSSSLIY